MSNFEATEALAATLFGPQDDANAYAAAFAPAVVLPAADSVPLASPVPANHPVPAAADDGSLADASLANALLAALKDSHLVFPANPTPLAASPVPAADDAFFAAGHEEAPAFVFPARPAPLAASPIPAAVPAAAPAASVPVAAVDNSSFPADGSFYPADVANPAMSDNEFNVDMGNFNGDVGGIDGDNFRYFEFGIREAVDGNNNNNNNNNDGWAYLANSDGLVNADGSVNVQMPNNDLDDLLNDVLVAGTPAPSSNQADNLDPRLQAGEGYAQGGMEAPQPVVPSPVVPAVPSPVMPQPEPVAAPVQQGVPHPQAVQPQMPPPPFPPPSQFPAPLPTPTPTLLQQLQQHQQGQQQQQQQQQHQEHQPWKFAQKVGPKTFPLELRAEPLPGGNHGPQDPAARAANASLLEQLRQHNPAAFANVPLRQGQAGQPSQPLPGPQAPAAPAATAAPNADAPPVKRGPGRPKGAKNKDPKPKEPLHRVRDGAGSRVAKARPRSAADGEQILAAAAAAAAAANEEEQRPVESMEGVQHQHQSPRLTQKEQYALGLRQRAEGEAVMIMSRRGGPRPGSEELMTEEWAEWRREQEEEKKWVMQETLDKWFQENREEYLENLEDDAVFLLSPATFMTTARADKYRLPLRDDNPDEDMDVDVPPGGNAQPGGHHGHVDLEATIQEMNEQGHQLTPAQKQILERALNRSR